MTGNTKRILATAAVPCVFVTLAWVGGYDFNSRGFWPAYWLLITVCATFIAWNLFAWMGDKP